MLVIRRRGGQAILIGGGDSGVPLITVKLLSDDAKIGIDAPRDVPVHREEVADEIREREGEIRPGISKAAPTLSAFSTQDIIRNSRKDQTEQ